MSTAYYGVPASTYSDLGRYAFTTAPDTSGQNTGNMTSVLDTSVIKVAKFELYRLQLSVSNAVALGQTPQVVQQATPTLFVNSVSSIGTLNFPNNTTLGNTVVLLTAGYAGGNIPGTATAVVLNGLADNWGTVPLTQTGDGINASPVTTIWADPDCGVSGNQVLATVASVNGTSAMWAYEFAGGVKSSSMLSVVDIGTGAVADNVSPVNSLSTPVGTTTIANDIAFGVASWGGTVPVSANTAALQPTGWTFTLNQGGVTSMKAVSAYTIQPSALQPLVFSTDIGTLTEGASASVAAFLPGTSGGFSANTASYKVLIDNQVWDTNVTNAGSGFTYDLQHPVYLNQGQQISILWTDLPSSAFSKFATFFTVGAWFRYDPTIPGNQT